MRKLIINADDFGASSEINDAVIVSHTRGIVTSASLLITGKASSEAVSLAKNHPSLDIGLHLNLTDGRPITRSENIKTLIDKDGKFLGYDKFTRQIWKFKIKPLHIAIEVENQIKRFLSYGLVPSHLDSHCFITNIPQIFWIVYRLANKYNIKCIRGTFNLYIGENGHKYSIKKKNFMEVSKFAYKTILNTLLKINFMTTDYILSFRHYFSKKKSEFIRKKALDILRYLPDGVSEIICHPGVTGERKQELDFLIDPKTKKLIIQEQIKLISWAYFLKQK